MFVCPLLKLTLIIKWWFTEAKLQSKYCIQYTFLLLHITSNVLYIVYFVVHLFQVRKKHGTIDVLVKMSQNTIFMDSLTTSNIWFVCFYNNNSTT